VKDLGVQMSYGPASGLSLSGVDWTPELGPLSIAGGSATWIWAGDGDNGDPVPNGLYEIHLTQAGGTDQSVAVWVKHLPQVASLLALPNPATGPVTFYWSPFVAGEVHLRIYELSGGLVNELWAPANSGQAGWDLRSSSGADIAGGLYVVRLDLQAPGQRVRQSFKLAVTR
jgi:hypothetical protein